MLVDTHLHIIDKSRLRYPWLAEVPALDRDFLYAEYKRQALRAGISDAIHMEVDVALDQIEAEIAFAGEQSRQPGSLVRGCIAACRPEEPGFAALVERHVADPFVLGFRRLINPLTDGVSDSRIFVENIRRLGGTRLTFDAHVHAHQIERAIALADAAPDVSFILDHCGVPDISADSYHRFHGDIAELAKRPNVVVKISGVVDSGNWTVETLRPWVEHVVGSFGWDRVVWGSDWPVCTLGGGLLAWTSATYALLAGCTNEEREKLFWCNADRIWKLGLTQARASQLIPEATQSP